MSTAEPKLRRSKRTAVNASHTNGASHSVRSDTGAPRSGQSCSAASPRKLSHTWLCGLAIAILAVLGVSVRKLWPTQPIYKPEDTAFASSKLVC